jgi:carboxypeptidase family protein
MNISFRRFTSVKRVGSVLGKLLVKYSVAVPIALLFAGVTFAQSTFGTILGTVRDSAENVLPNAAISLTNAGTSAIRTAAADSVGNFSFSNLEPGNYALAVDAPGFQKTQVESLNLQARETKRVDVLVKVSTQTESVDVVESGGAVVNTDVSNIAETKTGRELVDLPDSIYSHSAGSTSPISTLTYQPGVQTDSVGNMSVAGNKPSSLSVTLDGISTMAVNGSAAINELFPSFNSIAEIRVSEENNAAEYGGIADITTISKSGTNSWHGGLFENNENAAYDANNPFATTGKPKLIMNDFGGFLGGPVAIPHLYNGHDKTFFFMSYEGLRLPRQVPILETVPTAAMRQGNLCGYLASLNKTITNPNGTPLSCNIPASEIAPVSANVLNYLFPLPNTNLSGYSNNYQENFAAPISSDQADLRIDQVLTSKQSIFVRGTYKIRSVIGPAATTTGSPTGSALLGSFSLPEQDYGLTVSYNYVITPTLINELRGGFSGNRIGFSNPTPAAQATTIAQETGLLAILATQGPLYTLPAGVDVPNFNIAGFQATGGSGTITKPLHNGTDQILEALTWTKQKHTLKFGGDYRYMTGFYPNVFATNREGVYTYTGVSSNVGNAFAGFLLGFPDTTQVASVIEPDTKAYGSAYSIFAQDDWKVNSRLTLNLGLRWEYHPMFQDHLNNTDNFLPDYYSVQNGVVVRGAVVIPNTAALSILNPGFVASIFPTPVFTATQLGLPPGMRYSQKDDFAPRFGFAWRPIGNDKTVLRGGFGKYIETPLGSLIASQYGVTTTNNNIYNQSVVGGVPTLAFPTQSNPNLSPFGTSTLGTQTFQAANGLHYKDPYVLEWNLTIERDLGYGTALRVSYDGNHATDLSLSFDDNQVPVNTVGFNAADTSRPFPQWGKITSNSNGAWANYNALTAEVVKKFNRGLQFQASYTFARNLSNEAGGSAPTAFATEGGTNLVSDIYNLGLDYGNVSYTRKNRFLATYLYEFPVGPGKKFLSHGVAGTVLGGWEAAGVLLFQSGPFLTASIPGADPSGTGYANRCGCNGRPDIVTGVSPYATNQSASNWLNAAAFAAPPTPPPGEKSLGRFGTAPVGSMQGPGTQAVSLSLIKTIKFAEKASVQIGAETTNLFNKVNFAPPNTTLNTKAFGTISAVQTAEGSGPRAIQLTARVSF